MLNYFWQLVVKLFFSARWNAKFGGPHPNFYDFVEKVHDILEKTSDDIGRLDADPPIRITRPQRIKNVINQKNLREAERELESGGSVMQFLRKARHSFGKVNKRYFNLLQAAIEEDDQLGGDIEDDDATEDIIGGEVAVDLTIIWEALGDTDEDCCLMILAGVICAIVEVAEEGAE